jgi:hypothetical protein
MVVNTATAPPSAQRYLQGLSTTSSHACENLRPFATKCPILGTSMTKAQRRKLHGAINELTGTQVAAIVRQEFPRAKGDKINALAKAVVAKAHRQISPRLPRKTG